jgi:hypothetical protein
MRFPVALRCLETCWSRRGAALAHGRIALLQATLSDPYYSLLCCRDRGPCDLSRHAIVNTFSCNWSIPAYCLNLEMHARETHVCRLEMGLFLVSAMRSMECSYCCYHRSDHFPWNFPAGGIVKAPWSTTALLCLTPVSPQQCRDSLVVSGVAKIDCALFS